jgi:hypothetical protein
MSLKFGSKSEALEGFQRAMAIREELVAANPEYTVGRGQLAFIYKGLGDYFATVAAESPENRAGNWQQAKSWYRKSLDIWTDLQQKKTLDVDDAKEPDDLKRKIEKCDAALAKLQ